MSTDQAERDPVEALAAEFTERRRRGEQPTVEEYVRKYPELAEEIRDLFPTIAALEGWKEEQSPLRPRPAAPAAVNLKALGDYRIIREVGRGGMGIVYEAEQESLERRVAVKVLPHGPVLGEKQLRRFEREARTAARLHHTNIVPVFGVGEQDGLHYYVMQFIRGVGLDAVIGALRRGEACLADAPPGVPSELFTAGQAANALRSGTFPQVKDSAPRESGAAPSTGSFVAAPAAGGSHTEIHAKVPLTQPPLPIEEAAPLPAAPRPAAPASKAYWQSVARLGRQVASALDYAHSQNVLHRDIKPANLLLDATGTVWVADFGLAKVLERDGVSNTGDVVGTLQYMAPELFHGDYDARSDICSLGLTLYEMLALQPAFQDSNHSRLIHRITQEEAPRLRRLNPALPRDLETVIHKAIARDPARRYQSAREMHDDLERLLEDRPIQARRVGYTERLLRWCRRNPAVAGLTVLAISLLLLVAAVASVGYVRTSEALAGESEQRKLADANAQEMHKQEQRAQALAGEEKLQRLRAEATANLSLEVLEEIFDRLAPPRVVAASQLAVAGAGDEEVEVALQPTLSPETAALLKKLLVFYDRLAEQGNNDSKVRRQAARANRRVGDIQLLLGQTDHALDAYRRSIVLHRELLKQFPNDTTLLTDLAGVYNAIGQTLRKNNQPDQAREAHATAISVLSASSFDAPPGPIRYELARTYLHLGRIAREPPPPSGPEPKKGGGKQKGKGDPRKSGGWPGWAGQAEADQYFSKAVQLLRVLEKEDAAVPAYRHLLALCYREKSTVLMGPTLRLDGADRREAVGLLEQLVKQFPQVPEYRFDLSETLAWLDVRGPYLPIPGAGSAARDLQEALRLAKELVVEHPNVPDYQVSKAQIHHRLALVQRQNHEPDKAEKNLRLAVDVQNSLVQRFPQVAFHQFMRVLYEDSLVDVLVDQKKWVDSRPLLESSIKHLKRIIEQDKGLGFLAFALADNQARLARVLRELHERRPAVQAALEARELRQALPKGPFDFGKGDKKGPPGGKK
jgi:serine/threonine protein kinase